MTKEEKTGEGDECRREQARVTYALSGHEKDGDRSAKSLVPATPWWIRSGVSFKYLKDFKIQQ